MPITLKLLCDYIRNTVRDMAMHAWPSRNTLIDIINFCILFGLIWHFQHGLTMCNKVKHLSEYITRNIVRGMCRGANKSRGHALLAS